MRAVGIYNAVRTRRTVFIYSVYYLFNARNSRTSVLHLAEARNYVTTRLHPAAAAALVRAGFCTDPALQTNRKQLLMTQGERPRSSRR